MHSLAIAGDSEVSVEFIVAESLARIDLQLCLSRLRSTSHVAERGFWSLRALVQSEDCDHTTHTPWLVSGVKYAGREHLSLVSVALYALFLV